MFSFRFGKKKIGGREQQVRIVALLAYLGIFCLIPLFSRNDLYRYHAKQGLAILLTEFCFSAFVLAAAFFIQFGSVLHFAVVIATAGFWVFTTGLRVIGISYAAREMEKDVPVAGYLAKKLIRF